MLERVIQIVGHDTLEIFGPSGSGKTTFALELVREALEKGLKVIYIDTERNLPNDLKREGLTYYYCPELNELLQIVRNMGKADLYVLDSLGYPVLTRFALASMNEKGQMLLKAIALVQYFKLATWKGNSLAVITNQPVSEFGKSIRSEDLPPFGDKSIYAFKEVWRTKLISSSPEATICEVHAWRSRKYGRGRPLFRIEISDNGVKVHEL